MMMVDDRRREGSGCPNGGGKRLPWMGERRRIGKKGSHMVVLWRREPWLVSWVRGSLALPWWWSALRLGVAGCSGPCGASSRRMGSILRISGCHTLTSWGRRRRLQELTRWWGRGRPAHRQTTPSAGLRLTWGWQRMSPKTWGTFL